MNSSQIRAHCVCVLGCCGEAKEHRCSLCNEDIKQMGNAEACRGKLL